MIGEFQAIIDGLNMLWLMVVCIFLFMMQVAFTFMAPGAAHAKSSSSILTNHLIIVSTVTLVFLLISSDLIPNSLGGVVGGPSGEELIIKSEEEELLNKKALRELDLQLLTYMRCITCTTIAAVQLRERTLVETYFLLSLGISGIIFPVVQSWMLGNGWLNNLGFIDPTGTVCIFVCGGVTGFVGNFMLGSRLAVYKHLIHKSKSSRQKSYLVQRAIDQHNKKSTSSSNYFSRKEDPRKQGYSRIDLEKKKMQKGAKVDVEYVSSDPEKRDGKQSKLVLK